MMSNSLRAELVSELASEHAGEFSNEQAGGVHSVTTLRDVKTTCCYCGVGCGVIATTDGAQVLAVRGDPDHPANFGRLCSKGNALHLTAAPLVQQQVRALIPELRKERGNERTRASWDDTLAFIAQKFASTILEHGPDSVGFYISGQLMTEDYYVFNKLAKGLIGTNNIDTNSRLCMSSAVAGYKQTLGADAPPCSYEDIDAADVVFIVGSNMAYAHPVLYRRLEDARRRNPQMKVIVADPRCTDTARDADLFLPILPGTDVALFNGMLHICVQEGMLDLQYITAHTEGFAELKQTVRDYPPALVAQVCGILESDLMQAARWFGRSRAALSLYCQGLNQSSSGTAKNAALINLHLATRQIGKPGAGPFSLTGQPNAMGGREVGGMANLMSAHRDMANPQHRAEVAALWGVPDVPSTPGKSAVELFEAVARGDIKIVWIACTNPAQSMPDQKLIRAALEKAELVIVQEAFVTSATVAYADVLLPASTWGEKEGTVTNSERRITRVHPVLPKPGESRHDWEIVGDFAAVLAPLLGKSGVPFLYTNTEQIWNEHRASTRGTDIDITGLSFKLLDEAGPQQWPYPQGASGGKTRLYEDGVFPTVSGRARFVDTRYQQVTEPVDARYPFHLNTGRLRDQWHGMSRSGTVANAFSHAAEASIALERADMNRLLLKDGDLVHVTSRRGTQILPAQAGFDMRPSQAFIAMHWGQEYLSGRASHGAATHGVNGLTQSAIDPSSKQPELKHAAVKIVKAELPWRFLVFGWVDAALALQMQLRPHMAKFAYASCTLFGSDAGASLATAAAEQGGQGPSQGKVGVLLRVADDCQADPQLLSEIEALFGISGAQVLRYDDSRRGNARHLLVRDGKLEAVALAGDIGAGMWLKQTLADEAPVAAFGRLLLSPSNVGPQGFKPRGKVVCSCFNVAQTEIAETLLSMEEMPFDTALATLQGKLKCGTNCGSCVPELKQMVTAGSVVAPA
jgi:assimilatory nitrate reductase catalytic subunit